MEVHVHRTSIQVEGASKVCGIDRSVFWIPIGDAKCNDTGRMDTSTQNAYLRREDLRRIGEEPFRGSDTGREQLIREDLSRNRPKEPRIDQNRPNAS